MLGIDPDAADIDPDPIPEAAPEQLVHRHPERPPGRVEERHIHPTEAVDRQSPAVVHAATDLVHPLPYPPDVQHILPDHDPLQTPVDDLLGRENPAPEPVRNETFPDTLNPLIGPDPNQDPAPVRVLI